MLTKRLHTACKRTSLLATLAFLVAATFPMTITLANGSNAPSNGGEEIVSNCSTNGNPTNDSGVTLENGSNK
jgi:hypothetical protein